MSGLFKPWMISNPCLMGWNLAYTNHTRGIQRSNFTVANYCPATLKTFARCTNTWWYTHCQGLVEGDERHEDCKTHVSWIFIAWDRVTVKGMVSNSQHKCRLWQLESYENWHMQYLSVILQLFRCDCPFHWNNWLLLNITGHSLPHICTHTKKHRSNVSNWSN